MKDNHLNLPKKSVLGMYRKGRKKKHRRLKISKMSAYHPYSDYSNVNKFINI